MNVRHPGQVSAYKLNILIAIKTTKNDDEKITSV